MENVISDEMEQPESYRKLFNFQQVKSRLKMMIDNFKSQKELVDRNRKARNVDVDVQALIKSGKLKEDETMLPQRVIDSNIRREQPPFIAYLKQSPIVATFSCLDDEEVKTEQIANEFTRGLTYPDWEIPFFKVVDGSQTHGWDVVEITFDTDKPLDVGVEHIGNDKFIFPLQGTQNIQDCEVVMVEYDVTPAKLKLLTASHGFNGVEVNKLTEDKINDKDSDKTMLIYKKYCKYNGIVYISWFSMDAEDWLKKPEKFYIGIRELVSEEVPVPIVKISPLGGVVESMRMEIIKKWVNSNVEIFPIFLLPYYETEQPNIVDHNGRVFLDKHKQEAMTTNITAFTNAVVRSSGLYASPKESGPADSKNSSIKLEHGKVAPKALDFWTLPAPPPYMLELAKYLEVSNSNEVGQPTFAVNNRQDSRKTATEISSAKEELAKLTSVQVTLFSTFLRKVYTFIWAIVQNRAQQGVIKFLEGREDRDELLSYKYDIRAAGDVYVLKKAERLLQYKEFWPVVQSTPIGPMFLSKMLKIAFEDDGELFARELEKADRTKIILTGLIETLRAVMDEEDVAALTPESMASLKQLMQEGTMLVTQPAV